MFNGKRALGALSVRNCQARMDAVVILECRLSRGWFGGLSLDDFYQVEIHVTGLQRQLHLGADGFLLVILEEE